MLPYRLFCKINVNGRQDALKRSWADVPPPET